MKNIFKLFHYIKGFYLRVTAITVFSLVIAAINAYRPQIYKQIVDIVTQRGAQLAWSDVMPSFWILLILSIIWVVINYSFNIMSSRTSIMVRSVLKVRVFNKLTALSVEYFDTNRPGAVIQKVTNGIGSFGQWVVSLNHSLLGPIFSILVITVILFTNSVWLGILSLAIVTTSSLEYRLTIKRNKADNKLWREYNETSAAIITETIQNMTTVATLSSFQKFRNNLVKSESNVHRKAVKVRTRWHNSGARQTFYNEAIFLGAVAVILHETISGRFSVGQFVALTSYFGTIRSDASAFAQFIPDTDQVERDAERLVEVLEAETSFPDSPSARPLTKLSSIEFRDVTFVYPENKKGAIHNISFRIDATKSIALVGPSGVGKSTITKLLLRFYAPASGEIFINDEPAINFTHESIREHIGMVMQDVALFNTTIKENLRLTKTRATMAQLQHAAEQAHAHEFIENLPKQYNTVVGERGVKLSGGQKQRIAITRAILKDPSLIILDEATSALDSESERAVQSGLNQLMKGRLSLTIAHRLSTVRNANEILVLKDGKVSERGTHNELIKKPKGLYKKLFDLQSATGKVSL